jgi:hypothetical protein
MSLDQRAIGVGDPHLCWLPPGGAEAGGVGLGFAALCAPNRPWSTSDGDLNHFEGLPRTGTETACMVSTAGSIAKRQRGLVIQRGQFCPHGVEGVTTQGSALASMGDHIVQPRQSNDQTEPFSAELVITSGGS